MVENKFSVAWFFSICCRLSNSVSQTSKHTCSCRNKRPTWCQQSLRLRRRLSPSHKEYSNLNRRRTVRYFGGYRTVYQQGDKYIFTSNSIPPTHKRTSRGLDAAPPQDMVYRPFSFFGVPPSLPVDQCRHTSSKCDVYVVSYLFSILSHQPVIKIFLR